MICAESIKQTWNHPQELGKLCEAFPAVSFWETKHWRVMKAFSYWPENTCKHKLWLCLDLPPGLGTFSGQFWDERRFRTGVRSSGSRGTHTHTGWTGKTGDIQVSVTYFRKIHKTIWHRLVENIWGSHYSRIISLHWLMLRKRAWVWQLLMHWMTPHDRLRPTWQSFCKEIKKGWWNSLQTLEQNSAAAHTQRHPENTEPRRDLRYPDKGGKDGDYHELSPTCPLQKIQHYL